MKEITRVSQKAIVLNEGGRFLVLFRTETAPANPNTWDFPGGELDYGEDPIASIKREIEEEAGLEIGDIQPFDVEAHINEKDEYWVTVAYKAKALSDKVTLSFEHNDFRWVTTEEFLQLKSQPKLQQFAKNL